MEIIIALFFIVGIIALALFYNALSWGFVVSKFYLWFILAMYPQAPTFTIMQFIGIMFFLSAIMPKYYGKAIKKEYSDDKDQWITLVLAPWITFILGWLMHLAY